VLRDFRPPSARCGVSDRNQSIFLLSLWRAAAFAAPVDGVHTYLAQWQLVGRHLVTRVTLGSVGTFRGAALGAASFARMCRFLWANASDSVSRLRRRSWRRRRCGQALSLQRSARKAVLMSAAPSASSLRTICQAKSFLKSIKSPACALYRSCRANVTPTRQSAARASTAEDRRLDAALAVAAETHVAPRALDLPTSAPVVHHRAASAMRTTHRSCCF